MTQALQTLIEFLEPLLAIGGLTFIRIAAFMALLPAFGERSVPTRVKLGLSVVVAFIVSPALNFETVPALTPFSIVAELLNGSLLGLGLRLLVLALQTAGAIAAQSTSLSQLLGGSAADPMPAIGHIMVSAGLALAVLNGLHVKAVALLIYSYDLLPVAKLPIGNHVYLWGVDQVVDTFRLSFSLAAPFVTLSILYNLALGVINRAMPQLMVAFVGAPVITAGGLALLFLCTPLLLEVWWSSVNSFILSPTGD